MFDYNSTKKFWDKIFIKRGNLKITSTSTGVKELDDSIIWISDCKRIMDFGCGNGSMLIRCALQNDAECLGIDISSEAINTANEKFKANKIKGYSFISGGVEVLDKMEDSSFDGIILYNIIDNLHPKDADQVLKEIKRILKNHGKIILKVNPYITEEEVKEWNMTLVEKNFYKEESEIYLHNLTTEEWKTYLSEYFKIDKYIDVYYEKHKRFNRLFYLINK
ncbi:class I SAM-dependent methyltransferase [Mycoplasmatota bacterium zrk1]